MRFEQSLPLVLSLRLQAGGGLGEWLGCNFLNRSQEFGKPGQQQRQVQVFGQRSGSPVVRFMGMGLFDARRFQISVERLLETGDVPVELQYFGGKGMCRRQFLSALDAPLPLGGNHFCGGFSRVTCSYQRRWCILAQAAETSPRMIEVKPPRTMAVPM